MVGLCIAKTTLTQNVTWIHGSNIQVTMSWENLFYPSMDPYQIRALFLKPTPFWWDKSWMTMMILVLRRDIPSTKRWILSLENWNFMAISKSDRIWGQDEKYLSRDDGKVLEIHFYWHMLVFFFKGINTTSDKNDILKCGEERVLKNVSVSKFLQRWWTIICY